MSLKILFSLLVIFIITQSRSLHINKKEHHHHHHVDPKPYGPYQDPLCNTFDSHGKCTKCSFRAYFEPDGKCVNVNPQCKTFDNKNGDCLSCYVGYTLSDGDCSQ